MTLRRVMLFGALAALSVLWGIAFIAIKQALRELSPASIAVLRFVLADVALIGVMAAWPAARPRFVRGDMWRLAVLGVTGVPAYHIALNWGTERTSASAASLVVATAPVLVAILGTVVLREHVTARGAAGIALAFAGVAMLALRAEGGTTRFVGLAVAMLAPLSWAVYTIVAKPLTRRASAIAVTATSMLLGSLALVPFLPRALDEARTLSGEGWAWVVWLGAGGSAAGYVLFNFALARMRATELAVAIYAIPLVALLGSAVVLDEPLGWAVAAAGALVVGGVALVQRGGVRSDEPMPPPTEEPIAIRARA